MPKNKDILSEDEKNKFSSGQKFVFGIVLLFGFGILIFGFVQIKHNLESPFVSDKSKITKKYEKPKTDLEKILELKNKDTDQDGLSDYDELNIYNTSAYIEDSDSDGINDKEEIEQGQDPNCPIGKDCYGLDTNSEGDSALSGSDDEFTGSANPEDLMKGLPAGEFIKKPDFGQLGGLGVVADEGNLLNLLGQEMSAEQIRTLLIEAGMEKQLLDKIDDETLIKTYNSAIEDADIGI